MRHHRTSTSDQDLSTELCSPPTYWIGLATRASSGSSVAKSEPGSTSWVVVIIGQEYLWSRFDPFLAHARGLPASGLSSLLSLIHISEPTRRTPISYAVFCL